MEQTKNIQLVFADRDLYISAYESDKLYPQFSDIGYIFQGTDETNFQVYVRTNTGWEKSVADTVDQAKETLKSMYQLYLNRYCRHIQSLFPTSKIDKFKITL